MIQFPPLAQYLLESSICLLVFYILYKIVLQQNTFFQINRLYLLAGALLSFLIPMLHLNYQQEDIMGIAPMIQNAEVFTYTFNESMEQSAPVFSITIGQLFLAIYAIGVIFFGFRFFRKLHNLYLIGKQSQVQTIQGKPTLHTKLQDTSSFFKWMFLNPRHQHEDQNLIIEHEMVHIRQWHSADVVLMELITIINWFNPIIHLYNRSLREIHEFIADKIVAAKAGSTYKYAKLLVAEVGKSIHPSLPNTFASLIKKRLLMLSTKKSRRRKGILYLSCIPVVALLLSLFSFNLSDENTSIPEVAEKAEFIVAQTLVNESPKPTSSIESNLFTDKASIQIGDYNIEKVLQEGETQPYFKGMLTVEQFHQMISNLNDFQPEITIKGKEIQLDNSFIVVVPNKQDPIKIDLNRSKKVKTIFTNIKSGDQIYFTKYTEADVLKNEYESYWEYLHIDISRSEISHYTDSIVPSGEIHKIVEKMPHFSGCEHLTDNDERKKCSDEHIIEFINKNIRYPQEARIKGKEGMAVIRFVVEKDGSLVFPKKTILRNPGNGLGEEALRVVKLMPNWVPGSHQGKKVTVQFTLPIKFQLADEETPAPPAPPRPPLAPTPPPPPGYGNDVFKVVEQMPVFSSCGHIENINEQRECSKNAIIEYLIQHLKYPEEARKNGVEGTAVIQFTVEKDGSLSFSENPILRNPGGGTGEEALRVVKLMPKWIPGRQRGKIVKVQYNLPVKFELNNSNSADDTAPK